MRYLTVFFTILLVGSVAIACAPGDDDDDSNDTGDDDAQCSISGDDLSDIPFSQEGTNECENIGLSIHVDKLFASPDMTRFEIQGQYYIENDNVYFLRGAGIAEGEECYDRIQNEGMFKVRAEYLGCPFDDAEIGIDALAMTDGYAGEIRIDVLATIDGQATAFCSFYINSNLGCGSDDDDVDDDSLDDDDWWDDDWWDDDWWDDDGPWDDDEWDDDTGDDDTGDDDTGDDDTGDDDSGDDDTCDDDTAEIWTDSSSGLTWQVTPSSEYLSWEEAIVYCENLPLEGGGWHLPTISELRTSIRGCDATETGGLCGVTDSCLGYGCQDGSCFGCVDDEGPNHGCYWPCELPEECERFWSSSMVENYFYRAWFVNFPNGGVDDYDTESWDNFARCVR